VKAALSVWRWLSNFFLQWRGLIAGGDFLSGQLQAVAPAWALVKPVLWVLLGLAAVAGVAVAKLKRRKKGA